MKNTIKIMLAILAVTLITGMGTANMAEAKAKAYKTKTIKVTEGKYKTIKTKKKIKKIIVTKGKYCFGVGLVHKDGSVWDNPKAAKGKKKFAVWGTDYGRKYEVKVTYTNKYTQKFKIKTTLPTYAQKIVNELKPLLADPDNGLQTVLAQWEKKLGYECEFRLITSKNSDIVGQPTYLTLDEVMKNYTTSQKKALILEVYFRTRMTYSTADRGKYCTKNRGSNAYFKKLYNGTFKGVCSDGATMGYDICQYLGIKSKNTSSHEMDHAWLNIYVTDKNGKSYWQGIHATSYAFNLKTSVPKDNLTRKQVEKYSWDPYKTYFHAKKKQSVKIPTTTSAATATSNATATSAPTASLTITEPIKDADGNILVMPSVGYTCPGCSPLNPPPIRHSSTTNPYITNSKTTYKEYAVYQHVIGTEIRYFDENGNEYFDVNNNGTIMDELIRLAG